MPQTSKTLHADFFSSLLKNIAAKPDRRECGGPVFSLLHVMLHSGNREEPGRDASNLTHHGRRIPQRVVWHRLIVTCQSQRKTIAL
jgi:hypothetical protein